MTASSDPTQAINPTATAGKWGRAWEVNRFTALSTLLLITTTPLMVVYFFIACTQFQGSLWEPARLLFTGNLTWAMVWSWLPPLTMKAVYIFAIWFTLQVILATAVPDTLRFILRKYRGGMHYGSVTPGGHILAYNINGLQAWVVSHILFVLGAFTFGLFSPTIIFDNFGSLLWVTTIFGNLIALLAYVKARFFPHAEGEYKYSGNALYDYFMGIEFNPRIGKLDFKLFFNGRPGIVAWTLINLSFAAKQYYLYGQISNSMIIVNVLHALYVLYFFWNEAWYLKTIDICHDHFGWMLGYGDCTWLPYMYTLQGLYLVYNPVHLSSTMATFIWCLGLAGFWIFCSSNNQKDKFKQSGGTALIWRKEPKTINCEYTSADGMVRKSKLLVSGYWGIARHFNYTADLMGCLAYCMACGFSHVLPYFYVVYMGILLVHRCIRDEHRCHAKYGKAWDEYCSQVPYRLIPGVF